MMRVVNGIGLAALLVASLGAEVARAGEGAAFDGRRARKEMAERYDKVQRDKQRSWQDEDEEVEDVPIGRETKGRSEGSMTPQAPRAAPSGKGASAATP